MEAFCQNTTKENQISTQKTFLPNSGSNSWQNVELVQIHLAKNANSSRQFVSTLEKIQLH